VAFKTAAVNRHNARLRNEGMNAQIYIPGLARALSEADLSHENLDGWLMVNDVGGGLDLNTIDVYVGEGREAYRYYLAVSSIYSTPVYLRQ